MTRSIQLSRLSALVGLIGIAGASLSGCGGGGSTPMPPPVINPGGTPPGGLPTPGTTPYTSSRQAGAAACQANPHQNGRARWTILVYMNAASNLQPDSLLNVAQMASVGSDANVNIVVQWKQASSCPYFSSVNACGTPSFVGTHRYYILAHNQTDVNAINNGNTASLENANERLPDPATNVNGTSDMGDYHTLADFVQWGTNRYPADHLAVVIWDHGSGALPVINRATGRRVRPATRAVSQDANTGNQIHTEQTPPGLATTAQPIDMLIIDCSLQATTEVAYQVRHSARVMVGSEESPPGSGYPYDAWINDIKNSGQNPCDTGNALVRETIAIYPGQANVTQSMIDLSQMDTVAAAVNTFGSSLLSHVNDQRDLIYNSRYNSQYYDFPEYKDLYHFANLIRASSGVPTDLSQAALNVQVSLYGTTGAILAAAHGSSGQAASSGLTIYLPGPQEQSAVDNAVGYDPAYNALGLASAAPNWPAFLQAQVK